MNINQNGWAVAVLPLLLNQFIPLSWITPTSKRARSTSYLWPWKIFLILTQGPPMPLAFFIIKIFKRHFHSSHSLMNSVNIQVYSLQKQTRTSTLWIQAWNSCLPWPTSSMLYSRSWRLSGTTLDLASETRPPPRSSHLADCCFSFCSTGHSPAPTLHTSPAARWWPRWTHPVRCLQSHLLADCFSSPRSSFDSGLVCPAADLTSPHQCLTGDSNLTCPQTNSWTLTSLLNSTAPLLSSLYQ